jgi:hypothetical protein
MFLLLVKVLFEPSYAQWYLIALSKQNDLKHLLGQSVPMLFCASYFPITKHYMKNCIFFPCGTTAHIWAFSSSVLWFLNHTQLTHCRTLLDERSARRRDLFLHRTTQHINTSEKRPCPQRDLNPRSQQPSGRRPMPLTARQPGSANLYITPLNTYCDMLSRWQRCYSNVTVPVV